MATIHKWLIGATVVTAGGATFVYFEDLGLKSTFIETFDAVSQKFSYLEDKSKYCKIVLTSEDKNSEILLCWDSDKDNLQNKMFRSDRWKRSKKNLDGFGENVKDYYAGVLFLRNKKDNSFRQFTQLVSEESETYFKNLSEFNWSWKKWRASRNIFPPGWVKKDCYGRTETCYEEIGDYFYLYPFTKGFKFPSSLKQKGEERRDPNLKIYLHPEEFFEKGHTDFKDIKREYKNSYLIPRKLIPRLNSEAEYQIVLIKSSPYNEFWNAGGAHAIRFNYFGLKNWDFSYRANDPDFAKISKALREMHYIDFIDMDCSDNQNITGKKRILNCHHKEFPRQKIVYE